jgi:hypothetical protein
MALPPKSLGTGRHVMAAPILDQGGRGLTNVPILFTLQALMLVGPSRQWLLSSRLQMRANAHQMQTALH